MSRERGRERERVGERGRWGMVGERETETERERERGEGRVMYIIHAPSATMFSEKGEGVQRRQIKVWKQ